jgi:DNA-binding response OmpR family regulator
LHTVVRCRTAGIRLALFVVVKVCILIVEDDAVLRKHLARLFMRAGYGVSTAACCAAAVEQLALARFDVLLLDVHLPDGNGLDLLATVGSERYPRLAVAMTALSIDENDLRAQYSRICRLLRKPVDLLQLLDIVRGSTSCVS